MSLAELHACGHCGHLVVSPESKSKRIIRERKKGRKGGTEGRREGGRKAGRQAGRQARGWAEATERHAYG